MEYILNKIDTNLRRQVNSAAKEGKVHAAKNITINKDKEKKEKENKGYKLQRYNKSKRLTVDTVKAENIEIEAYMEEKDNLCLPKGSYIDIKK